MVSPTVNRTKLIPMETPNSLQIREEDRGQRLDRFLAEQLRLSRSQVRRLLARGAVRLGGRIMAEGRLPINRELSGWHLPPLVFRAIRGALSVVWQLAGLRRAVRPGPLIAGKRT